MKRIIFSSLAVMVFSFVNAQNGHFKVGLHAGIPVGDSSDAFNLNIGADAAYLWKVTDKFNAGVATGFASYFPKSYNIYVGNMVYSTKEYRQDFVPVAGTVQYSLFDNLFIGADLGFALNIYGDAGGGFLYQPKLGFQTKKIELFTSYKAIAAEETISSLNIGFNYKF